MRTTDRAARSPHRSVRGAIAAVVLLAPSAASADEPPASSDQAAAADEAAAVDEVTLTDGRVVRGRVVDKQPGRWIVVETETGARRTLAWHLVAEIVEAPVVRDTPPVTTAGAELWRARANVRETYELRAQMTGLLEPMRTFAVEGTCVTGAGVVPASIYGQTALDRGRGIGGGIGGRAGMMFFRRLGQKEHPWWALRASGGLDLEMLYVRVPSGIASVDDELCTDVAKSRHEVRARPVPELLVRVPLALGGFVGLGQLVDPVTWRGVVVGLAWAPSFVHVGPWTRSGRTQFSPLGAELTLDITTLQAAAKKPEPHLRMAASLTVPVSDDEAWLGSLSFGWVWY